MVHTYAVVYFKAATYFYFFSYRACYTYQIDNDTCILMDSVVEDIPPIPVNGSNTTVYVIETPLLSTNLYPNNIVCYFVIGRK